MGRILQWLFKHDWVVFSKGKLAFQTVHLYVWILLLLIAVATVVYFVYIRPSRSSTTRPAVGLAALRVGVLVLLAILLMRPVIVVPSVIPKSTYVAVLVDDSQSMQLKDENGKSRAEAVKDLLRPDGSLVKAIGNKFKLNYYGFSSTATKIQDLNELQSAGTTTDVANGLQEIMRNSGGFPLSAIIVVSDGATNTATDLTTRLHELRTQNLPVYTIGTGSAERVKDAELESIKTPRKVLIGSAINAEMIVRLSGYQQTKILVSISEDGHALKTQDYTVPGNQSQNINIDFNPSVPGIHKYGFTITPLDGEMTAGNNTQETLIEVVDNKPKILYIEGEPRWEYPKIREALARNEKNITLVSVLRSADGKFYRQGIQNAQDLQNGFPIIEEELYQYQGIVLGSIEANFFTFEQLRIIEQFVSRRGGGLLALGGRFAFNGGKYANTPVADALPVILGGSIDNSKPSVTSGFKAVLTPRGVNHPIARLNENRDQNVKAWDQMPLITLPEVITQIKPGATVILEARNKDNRNQTVPLMVEQRYGRGKALALMADDTWRWRMELDSKNLSQENFWRQTLRYLVSTTPDQVECKSERDVYTEGEPVKIHADVETKKFEPKKDAQVSLQVTKPSGAVVKVPMQLSASSDNTDYVGDFATDEKGTYHVEMTAANGKENLGAAKSDFLVSDINKEFFASAQNVDLLKRIAAETSGKYYPVNKANDLVQDLTYRDGKNSELVTKELWDMPINFLLLIGFVGAEWFLRKKKGLA